MILAGISIDPRRTAPAHPTGLRGALALAVLASALLAAPAAAEAPPEATVSATLTVVEPGAACLLVDVVDPVDFGVMRYGATTTGPAYTVQSCTDAGQELFAHGTDAANGDATVHWALVDSAPGEHQFAVAAGLEGVGSAALGTEPTSLGVLPALESATATHTLRTPPAGEPGHTMVFDIVWTAAGAGPDEPVWSQRTSGSYAAYSLVGVGFGSPERGVVLNGQRYGRVHVTENGGEGWITASASSHTIRAVAFAAEGMLVWGAGSAGTIVASTDGGLTWDDPLPSGTSEHLTGIDIVGDDLLWAVGANATILGSADGGRSWSAQDAPAAVTGSLLDVSFVDAGRGWIAGAGGVILATTDGGATWVQQDSGTTVSLTGVSFVDVERGWAVGQEGTILATVDGGTNWRTQPSGTTLQLTAVDFVDDQQGWAVGYGGTIVATADGGLNWTAQDSGVTGALMGVSFVAPDLGWAAGQNGVVLTYQRPAGGA